MEQKDLQQLANIYNTLLTIHTNGQDSFVMVDTLRSLENFIVNKQRELNNQKEE